MVHSHDHGEAGFGKAFAIGVVLNTGFVLIEALYGWHAGSLALLADAGHNLSDVGGLLLAWAAYGAARLHPNERHTYGWLRGSILASFANAMLLLVAMGGLAWEALERLHTPSPIDGRTVMLVAGVGVIVNAITAWLFMAGSKEDLNIRGAFLHMGADAIVSLGVVLAGGLFLWQGWMRIDPILSLLIAVIVVVATWSLFRQSLHLLFDGVPDAIRLDEVHRCLTELPGVLSVHDLHVWALSTSQNALTAHLVVADGGSNGDLRLTQATNALNERFSIRHAVLQQESPGYAASCSVTRQYEN